MTDTNIGLKLANGEFYPVLADGVPARKRLIVTTVQDQQKSVQIDLYRGQGPRVDDGTYIGSLVVENIPSLPRGEPDIRLELSLGEEGLLSAVAEEASSGERQSLRVSLRTLEEEEKYEVPDFEFDDQETDGLPEEDARPQDEPIGAEQGLLATAEGLRDEEKRRRILTIAGAVLLGLALILGFSYFVYSCSVNRKAPASTIVEEAPPPAAPATPAPIAAAPPAPAQAAPLPPPPAAPIPAPPAVTVPAAPKPEAKPAPAAAKAPAATKSPSPGKRYRIRWGDTLWDLAYAYYGNPWLYPKIAKANKIRNPDRILAGSWITIPPR